MKRLRKLKQECRKVPLSWPIRLVVILGITGILGGIADDIAYQFYLAKQGIGFFDAVSLSIIWEYTKSFPGNLLTALTFGPWLVALAVCLWGKYKT